MPVPLDFPPIQLCAELIQPMFYQTLDLGTVTLFVFLGETTLILENRVAEQYQDSDDINWQ
jgi:hypothetical protein